MSKRLKNIYVAFTDFNTGLRDRLVHRKLEGDHSAACRCRPAAILRPHVRFIVERLLSFPTLVAVSVIIFLMVRLLPGNILDLFFAGDTAATRSRWTAREQLGLYGSYSDSTGAGSRGVDGDFGHRCRHPGRWRTS